MNSIDESPCLENCARGGTGEYPLLFSGTGTGTEELLTDGGDGGDGGDGFSSGVCARSNSRNRSEWTHRQATEDGMHAENETALFRGI